MTDDTFNRNRAYAAFLGKPAEDLTDQEEVDALVWCGNAAAEFSSRNGRVCGLTHDEMVRALQEYSQKSDTEAPTATEVTEPPVKIRGL